MFIDYNYFNSVRIWYIRVMWERPLIFSYQLELYLAFVNILNYFHFFGWIQFAEICLMTLMVCSTFRILSFNAYIIWLPKYVLYIFTFSDYNLNTTSSVSIISKCVLLLGPVVFFLFNSGIPISTIKISKIFYKW